MISGRLWRLIVVLLASSNLVMSVQEVIVVGGGLAGLCASIEAASNGAHVTLIEKENALGGNSAKATSGINGASTMYQEQHGIKDNYDLFEKDTLASGDGLSNKLLVKTLASSSDDAIQFLSSFDIKLDDIVQLGGHSVARTHRFSPTKDGRPVPVGFTLVARLKKHVETTLSNSVTVLLKRRFIQLIKNNEQVVGVRVALSDGLEKEFYGNVVLTAGGYAHDQSSDSILRRYAPQIYDLPTTNGPWATGDVIKATENDHLSLIHMDKVQIHPTSFLDINNVLTKTKFLATEALRGCGGILINLEGKRFVNELGRRDHVTKSIFQNCGHFENNVDYPKTCIMLFNEEVVHKFGAGTFNFYKSRGLIHDVGKLQDVSEKLSIDLNNLMKTISDYKQHSLHGLDNFNKSVFPVSFEPHDHFYASYITPAIHYCMGGLQINENSQVLSSLNNQPVAGLFAAGEVTGGVHGENRLGGNSLLECVVFGRIAGKMASEHIKVVHEEM